MLNNYSGHSLRTYLSFVILSLYHIFYALLMRNFLLLMSLKFLISACEVRVNPPEDQLDPVQGITESQADSVKSLIRHFPNDTQFAIALVEDSSVSYYGVLRTNDMLVNIENAEAVFEIGSISKVFTSAMLAQMAEEQLLSLNDPIQQHLDFPLNDSLQVTFKQLANHTSGLPRLPPGMLVASVMHPDNPYQDYDRQKLRKYMREEMSLNREPATVYEYSNLGAGMLGYVLEQINRQPYEELLQQRISGPFGMRYTTTECEKVSDRLVTGLDTRGKPAANWDLAALQGAGGILSTVADLATFAQANFDPANEALQQQREKTFTVYGGMDLELALGWHILTRESGERWHWHNGGTGGYRTSMVMDVEDKKAVIILTNMSAGHYLAGEIDQLSFTLLSSLQGESTAE
jgi:CubicO group peptidase (beta-lactamase class C family)